MHKSEEIAMVGQAVLKHSVTSTDQCLVCTMAMVCKGWRAAVKNKAPARLLDVAFKVGNRWAPDDAGMPSECMLKLASFSQWLPQHAKLVRKLEITGPGYLPRGEDDKNRIWFKALAETVFSLALRSAAAACIESSAQQQLQPLGLQSFDSDVLDTSAVLQSLPVASLTELVIHGSNRSALAAALPRLTTLQRLEIFGYDDEPMSAVLQAAQQLSALTELSFPIQCFSNSDVKLVPPHLLRLQLWVSGSDVVDFSHITRLTSLRISPGVVYKFPAQLVDLSIADRYINGQDDGPSVVSISNISSLTCLESLAIWNSCQDAEGLCQLVALPKLEKLSLEYNGEQKALAASAAWPKLRQLQDVDLDFTYCSPSACMQIFNNLGKVTWLTQLHADIGLFRAEQQAVPIAICSEICNLQRLKALSVVISGSDRLQQSSWVQDDLARLGDLTQLTKLDLGAHRLAYEAISVNDENVVQLLRKLKQLRELSVPVKSAAVLPVIAQLSNLRVLELVDLPEALQQSGLQYLQGMKSLTVLKGFDSCSKQELADFWAAMRA